MNVTYRKPDQTLKAWEAHSRLLIESIKDYAIFMLDPDGYIVTWNPGAERIKGFKTEEIVGRHFSMCFPPELHQSMPPEEKLKIAAEHGRYEEEGWLLHKNGSPFWANVIITAIRDDTGKLVGFAEVTGDLTERKKVEENLQRSNEELEHFAVIASHDLQAPLRKVRLFSDHLKSQLGDNASPEIRDSIERMHRSVDKMQNQIDDLLDLSRVNRKGRPFQKVALQEVLHEILADLHYLVEESHGRVEIGEMPTLEADPVQMQQLLYNLIENGLKFHRDGVPPVVKVSSRQSDDMHCDIVIEDNGIGIKEEFRERIFQVFERLHGEKYPGTGIGLALCRKIAERHGGAITVESIPDVGSKFTVRLQCRWPKL